MNRIACLTLCFLTVTLSPLLAGTAQNYISVADYGAVGNGTTPDQAAIQSAVNAALAQPRPAPILLTGRHLITSPIIINRLVDTTASELRFIALGPGAGLYTNANINIFDSTLTSTPASPQSESITFEGVQFEASSVFVNAYVLSGKFLRVKFLNCNFRLIRCLYSTTYAQTYYFQNCQMRNWPGGGGAGGYFFQSAGCYDVSFNGCIIENGGAFFRSTDTTRGTNGVRILNNVIEGLQGPTATITGASGVTIMGNHIESNPAADYNFWGGSMTNASIVIQGNYIYNPNGAAFYYGPTSSVTSIGNTYCSNNATTHPLHSNTVQITTLNSLGDVFVTTP